MLVLLSNAVFFGFLSFTRMGGIYFQAASVAQSRASPWGRWEWFRRRKQVFSYPIGTIEKIFNLLHWMDSDTRALLVKEGQSITQGQPIAEMGDTDTNRVMLHFELRYKGSSIDPSRYLPAR